EAKRLLEQREKVVEEEKNQNIMAQEKFSNDLASKRATLEEMKSSLEQRERGVEEEKQKNNLAQQKLSSDLASQRAALEEMKSSLEQRERVFEEEKEGIKRANEELSSDLASQRAVLKTTQDMLDKQTAELNLLKEQMNSAPAPNANYDSLKLELDQCRVELNRTTESFEEAGEKNLSLVSEKNELADELQEVDNQKNNLTLELSNLKRRFEEYQNEKKEELSELAKAKEAVKILTKDLEAKKTEQNELSHSYSTLQEENTKNLGIIDDLRKSISNQEVVFPAIILVSVLKEKESALKNLQMNHEIRMQELRDQLEDSKADLSQLKNQSSTIATEKVAQTGELNKLTEDNRKLTKELKTARASQETLMGKKKELQDYVDKLTSELKAKTALAKKTEDTLELKENLEKSRN
ncbi:hypothetical protein EV360DRAFT_77113, partial [Lentinula raphanica]